MADSSTLMLEQLLPLALFAFVSSITPGPNNIMLTSSGIRFGFARTIPHMLGISTGFGILLALCAAGIGGLILSLPSIQVVLKIISSAYLLYLAWQLRVIALKASDTADAAPMGFVSAALFQAVNPKAWVMAVTGVAAFMPHADSVWLAVALFCLVFCAVNLPCLSVWAGAGAILRQYLEQPVWRRAFCTLMVVLTVYSAAAVWL